METLLEAELYAISDNASDIQTVKELMILFLNRIFEIYWREGSEYYVRRKSNNEELMILADLIIKNLELNCKTWGISAKFALTSSLNAKINLMDESDIDISMMVDVCDTETALEVGKKLAIFGYEYKTLVNPFLPLNSYYSFNKIEDNIEIEIKLRGRAKSEIMLNLHNYMENKLSPKERIAITCGKLLFKRTSRKAYLTFKKLVYERYMAEIDKGFMLETHY